MHVVKLVKANGERAEVRSREYRKRTPLGRWGSVQVMDGHDRRGANQIKAALVHRHFWAW